MSVSQIVYMDFSKNIEQGVNFSAISLMAGQNSVSIATSVYANTLIIDPTGDLDFNTEYDLTIPAGALNEVSGSATNNEITLQFATSAFCLTMLSSDPANNIIGVSIEKPMTVTFDKEVKAGDNYTSLTLTTGGSRLLPPTEYQAGC